MLKVIKYNIKWRAKSSNPCQKTAGIHVSLFNCHHKYVSATQSSATICMKPVLPRSRQWCVSSSPSSHGILIYLYYLASAPQASLNPIRLAMSSVITGWAIPPWRPPVSDLCGLRVQRRGSRIHMKGFLEGLCWRRVMRKTPLQQLQQYLC